MPDPAKTPDAQPAAAPEQDKSTGAGLKDAGIMVPRNDQGELKIKIEISPLFALDKEDALSKIPPSLSTDKDILLAE